MDVLMVMIAVIGIAISIANKKKMKEAQKRRMAAPDHREAVPAAPVRPAQQRPAAQKASATKAPTLSKTPSAPGTSKWPWPAQNAQQPQKKGNAAPAYGGTPRYTHVVTSTLEGGHTHTESSLTGEEACPPPKAAAAVPAASEGSHVEGVGALLSFQPGSVLQGVLYAEILGKPKALQGK